MTGYGFHKESNAKDGMADKVVPSQTYLAHLKYELDIWQQ